MILAAPIAFGAAILAVRRERYGIASRMALVLSGLLFLLVLVFVLFS